MTRTSWRDLATDARARRVALDTLAVLALSWATAQHFDSTEWRLVSVFALYKALTESPILERIPHERERGRVSLGTAAALLVVCVLLFDPPRSSGTITANPGEATREFLARAERAIVIAASQ